MMDKKVARRNFIAQSAFVISSAVALPLIGLADSFKKILKSKNPDMDPILEVKPLGFQWETSDPFLFCVHHEDYFPAGTDAMEVEPKHLNGRHSGDDFIIKDGFRMYHGKRVPGFPGHPHRGFETITVVRKGLVDHADSMGAAGRYGNGDVQWMTAGSGVQHSEMFPLYYADKPNTMELFQIWLNLPAKNKMVKPHFKMLWKESLQVHTYTDSHHKTTSVEVVAGKLGEATAPAPPPDSWAADPQNEVAIWNVKMEKGASFELPPASEGVNRTLYFYEGKTVSIAGKTFEKFHSVKVLPHVPLTIQAGEDDVHMLILQGRPINEPVIQYGPFVMNTKQEINDAFEDYHATQFGGWPWPRYDQVHDKSKSRFAKFADGTLEEKAI